MTGCLLAAPSTVEVRRRRGTPSRRLAPPVVPCSIGRICRQSPAWLACPAAAGPRVIAFGRPDGTVRERGRPLRQAIEETEVRVRRGGAADAPPALHNADPHPIWVGNHISSSPHGSRLGSRRSARHARRAPVAPRPTRVPAATTPRRVLAARPRGPTAPGTPLGRRPSPGLARCRTRGRWLAPACRGRTLGCAPGRWGAAACGCSTRPWRHDHPSRRPQAQCSGARHDPAPAPPTHQADHRLQDGTPLTSRLGRAASSSRGGSLVLPPRPGWRDLAGRRWHARP
jgi:hypothetical protein